METQMTTFSNQKQLVKLEIELLFLAGNWYFLNVNDIHKLLSFVDSSSEKRIGLNGAVKKCAVYEEYFIG